MGKFFVGLMALLRDKIWNNLWAWRVLVIFIVIAILVGFYLGSGGMSITLRLGERSATVGGQTILLAGTPTIIDGNLYIPARSLFEAMGATVEWNQATGQAFISVPKTIIRY
jgi:hypothetical protein